MSKYFRDPTAGQFAKKPAEPLVLPPPDAASTSSRSPLVFPTLRSHPIPSSFISPAPLDRTSDGSNTEVFKSPNKSVSFTTFFDSLQHTRSLSPDLHSSESQVLSIHLDPLDDTEPSVPVSCSLLDSPTSLAA